MYVHIRQYPICIILIIGSPWTWGGCKESFHFAVQVSRVFVDNKDESRDARAFVNLHNNEAGRQVEYINLLTKQNVQKFWQTCVYWYNNNNIYTET